MPKFIKGLELNHTFYTNIVQPILRKHDKNLAYAAGLIGRGSEVLGYDDKMSTDHDWGPALIIFLDDDNARFIPIIDEMMRHDLPYHFRGYSTNYISAPEAPQTKLMAITRRGAINHKIHITTVTDYFDKMIGWSGTHNPDVIDWLTFPSQKLRMLTHGAVFHDGIGDLTKLRAQLAWYPDDVWLMLLSAQWHRIGEEEHLMGRAGYTGDDLGATLIANRLVQDIMRLCFLMEKEFAPYPKWFGRAFAELRCADLLSPLLRQMQLAPDWQVRQSNYAQIMEFMLDQHNQLNITNPMPVRIKKFHNRPFLVANGSTVSECIRERITDLSVRNLLSLPSFIGNIDQITDETGLREFTGWQKKLRDLYTPQ